MDHKINGLFHNVKLFFEVSIIHPKPRLWLIKNLFKTLLMWIKKELNKENHEIWNDFLKIGNK